VVRPTSPDEPLGLRAEAAAKGRRAHEVREGELAVDLDGGEQLAVASLEICPSADVDELELEAELFAERTDDL
jgi:hypothetical protein